MKAKRAPADYPGDTVNDWRTKRGKLTARARRYLAARDAEHYAYIARHYGARNDTEGTR